MQFVWLKLGCRRGTMQSNLLLVLLSRSLSQPGGLQLPQVAITRQPSFILELSTSEDRRSLCLGLAVLKGSRACNLSWPAFPTTILNHLCSRKSLPDTPAGILVPVDQSGHVILRRSRYYSPHAHGADCPARSVYHRLAAAAALPWTAVIHGL